MNHPEFPTVFRGYDPVQVDQQLAALQQSHESLSQELESQRRSLAELEQQARTVSSPTYADLGARIGTMLGLADEEAAAIRASAADEVERARGSADEEAALVRAEADRYAEEIRSRADV